MKYFVYISASFFLISCSNKKIEITSEYIINENWNQVATAIQVNKLKLKKDSTLDVANINQADFNKLEPDTSFIYYANVLSKHQSIKEVKIYFNRDNGFRWSKENDEYNKDNR